jgi:hypothetical protein
MARGSLRAATQNAYRGAAGATRQAHVQVTLPSGEATSVAVYAAVDVVADPELGQRLLADTLPVAMPVVYHDPANELMVLVLGENERHREHAERARLAAEIASEPNVTVPRYAREFEVVFGARGLRAFLEAEAERAVAAARQVTELERLRAELAKAKDELAAARAELEELRTHKHHDDAATGPFDLAHEVGEDAIVDQDAIPTANQTVIEAAPAPVRDDQTVPVAAPELPAGSDPVHTACSDVAAAAPDAWLQTFAAGNADAALAPGGGEDGSARIALRIPARAAGAMARGPLDLRLQLHRTPAYPLITITVGTPAALRGVAGTEGQRATASLDVAGELDRKALGLLCRHFVLTVDLVADGARLRRVVLVAPLEENAAYVTRAAHDHLRTLSAESNAQVQPSASRARQLMTALDYDLLGAHHPEASEFRDDKLTQLGTANQVRRALAIAKRFTRPSREDYLVTVRGYPLARWHERRRAVLVRAVEWGLWMGPELAHAAVSEGLARSRKDLVGKLQTAFATLLTDAVANDLDGDAAEDNRKAIDEEAKALGLTNGSKGTIASDDGPATSGTIERAPVRLETKGRSIEELVGLLDDRTQRVAAALELCERGDPRAIRPVVHSVRRMGRAEAVRVLGTVVKFGEAAAPALTAGLGSSKAFLRHGCALALGMLRTEAGTEAVIDLLISEPTEIWRELARAVGQIGPSALMPLAARTSRVGGTPAARERIAWAMAHIGVRGGRNAVETLAAGASAVAPVAKQALELMAPAARDDLRGTGPGREVTVNRAFSRKFFEALGQGGLAVEAGDALDALDASGPMELLDEADLIDVDGDAEEAEAELDESDLMADE